MVYFCAEYILFCNSLSFTLSFERGKYLLPSTLLHTSLLHVLYVPCGLPSSHKAQCTQQTIHEYIIIYTYNTQYLSRDSKTNQCQGDMNNVPGSGITRNSFRLMVYIHTHSYMYGTNIIFLDILTVCSCSSCTDAQTPVFESNVLEYSTQVQFSCTCYWYFT